MQNFELRSHTPHNFNEEETKGRNPVSSATRAKSSQSINTNNEAGKSFKDSIAQK